MTTLRCLLAGVIIYNYLAIYIINVKSNTITFIDNVMKKIDYKYLLR